MADYMHDIQESQKGDLENLNPEHLVEQMRGDRETYKVFYERFVRCIVGKKMFDYMIADADDCLSCRDYLVKPQGVLW